MKVLFSYFLLCCLFVPFGAKAQKAANKPKVIAHRGFWKTDGSAQNSIAALIKADSIGCYGSEFDVWMVEDGKLMVNHDAVFQGRRVENTNSRELKKLKLSNGERMPALKEYLKAAKKLRIRLILELKSLSSKEKETEAVRKIVKMVDRLGLNERVEYIAFSLHAAEEFRKAVPENVPVFYLSGDLSPEELKETGGIGLDYHYPVFLRHPQWIEEAHKQGMKVNSWTVNKKTDVQKLAELGVDFLTTDNPEEVMKWIE